MFSLITCQGDQGDQLRHRRHPRQPWKKPENVGWEYHTNFPSVPLRLLVFHILHLSRATNHLGYNFRHVNNGAEHTHIHRAVWESGTDNDLV